MSENEPLTSCRLCGYRCRDDHCEEGRYLKDPQGNIYHMKDSIICCKARKILLGDPKHPKNQARSIIEFPKEI